MLRLERDDLREAERRFALALLAVQQNAEVVVRVRVVGVDANGRSIRRLRFDDLSFGSQHDAQVVVSVCVIRVECDRLLVRRGRLVQLKPILQDDPEIAVPVGPIGLELEASRDQGDGLLALRLLMRENSREVQRVGMVGLRVEDGAVDLRSGRPLLGLLQHDRDRQRFVEAQRAIGARRLRRPDYPPLLALRSYLKWMPASRDPSAFCGRYSRSTLANARVTVSNSPPPHCRPSVTAVMITSLILMMRKSGWPLPDFRRR